MRKGLEVSAKGGHYARFPSLAYFPLDVLLTGDTRAEGDPQLLAQSQAGERELCEKKEGQGNIGHSEQEIRGLNCKGEGLCSSLWHTKLTFF